MQERHEYEMIALLKVYEAKGVRLMDAVRNTAKRRRAAGLGT